MNELFLAQHDNNPGATIWGNNTLQRRVAAFVKMCFIVILLETSDKLSVKDWLHAGDGNLETVSD